MRKVNSLVMASVLCLSFICSCGEETGSSRYNNIEAGGRVYISGTQTISLTGRTSAEGDAPAVFKSDVQTSDITLKGAFDGKTVQSVSFVSTNEIQLVLTGDVKSTSFSGSYTSGELNVASRALEGNSDSYCLVNILKPSIEGTSSISGGSETSKSYSTTYELPYGGFTSSATSENIKLKDQENGELTELKVSDDSLKLSVTVKNYNPTLDGATKYPQLVIPAIATTFNVDVTIDVGNAFASVLLA